MRFTKLVVSRGRPGSLNGNRCERHPPHPLDLDLRDLPSDLHAKGNAAFDLPLPLPWVLLQPSQLEELFSDGKGAIEARPTPLARGERRQPDAIVEGEAFGMGAEKRGFQRGELQLLGEAALLLPKHPRVRPLRPASDGQVPHDQATG